MCASVHRCVCLFLGGYLSEYLTVGGVKGDGEGGGVTCPVSYPRCLLISPYQCLCGSTYCMTFLVNFNFFKCAILISLTMPIKGKCV